MFLGKPCYGTTYWSAWLDLQKVCKSEGFVFLKKPEGCTCLDKNFLYLPILWAWLWSLYVLCVYVLSVIRNNLLKINCHTRPNKKRKSGSIRALYSIIKIT